MTITTINDRIKRLYDEKWANLNAWYPIGLYIPGAVTSGTEEGGDLTTKFKKASSAADTYKILAGLSSYASFFDGATSSYPKDKLQNIVSISGIPNASAGFKQDGTGLKENLDKNYASIGIKFYMEQDIYTWRFLQAWRSLWKTIGMSGEVSNSIEIKTGTAFDDPSATSLDGLAANATLGKYVNTIKTNGTQALPEGYLEMAHIKIDATRDEPVQELGILKITGLIPTDIPFIGEIGPGRSRGSDIPTLDCKFTASNIIYWDKASGLPTQFY